MTERYGGLFSFPDVISGTENDFAFLESALVESSSNDGGGGGGGCIHNIQKIK